MKIQAISNQQNFTGNAHDLLFSAVQAAKIKKALLSVKLEEKNYDLFFSELGNKIAITAKKTNSKSATEPRMTILANRNQDSFEYTVKSTMENYEGIIKEINKAKNHKK